MNITHTIEKRQTTPSTATWFSTRKIATCLAIAALSASTTSLAASHTDYAKVTNVSPIYETITIKEPHRECRMEERVVQRSSHRSVTPNIIGALIGGAIGNELGHNKSNKRVGAVADTILGGSIASDLNREGHHRGGSYTKTEQVCSVSHSIRHEKQVTGYDVNYKYRGQAYSTIMNSHPGDRIRVAVDVTPIDY